MKFFWYCPNNQYRNDIEYAIRVPIDNTYTFGEPTKEGKYLRNSTH